MSVPKSVWPGRYGDGSDMSALHAPAATNESISDVQSRSAHRSVRWVKMTTPPGFVIRSSSVIVARRVGEIREHAHADDCRELVVVEPKAFVQIEVFDAR